MKQILFVFAALLLLNVFTYSNTPVWQDASPGSFSLKGTVYLAPVSFRTVSLNKSAMYSILNSAPKEADVKAQNSNVIFSFPMPNGTMSRFKIVESSVMEPELQAKFPDIRTYLGQGIDDPYSVVRFDYTPLGFHAMILSPNGTVFIDPYSMNETDYYMSYYKDDFRPAFEKNFKCLTESNDNLPVYTNITNRTGEQLRTYRIAVAATGEYTAFFGGTVPAALAAIITSINRITGVYELEMSLRLVVVANNLLVIYTNGASDPYSNNNGGAMLGENQANLDAVIGTANYDIGHVYSTGNFGGIAGLQVVCSPSSKGHGATGSSSPVGDPWDIDYVAHEMGHQFAGNHTQNNINCNANPGTAWEPGSGITIMGYAGVCAPNLSNHSIPYMHGGNIFNEFIPFTQSGTGNNCPVTTNTGNLPPAVTIPAGGFTIPISTPFYLTGSAVDPDSDPLTYSWEQTNTGPQGNPNAPVGNAPLFRPFAPVTNGTRTFPKLSDIINNTQVLGEILPSYERFMRFRLTVRDNRAGGGGIGSEELIFFTAGTAGPFLVTYPNTNVTISGAQTVTWAVANTNTAPVSCANVKISLSTDGGNTFPTVLAASTANDGSEGITLPAINSTQARIKIEAVDNIFFDMSNANFTISDQIGISNNQNGTPIEFGLLQNFPNPFNPVTVLSYALPKKSSVTLKVYDAVGREIAILVNNETKTEGYYNVEFDASQMPSGIYYYRIEAVNSGNIFTDSKKMILVK
jgi:hypothetical protein